MEKSVNVPAAAVWNSTDNQWELGEKNAAGQPTGTWKYWHVDGHFAGTVEYGDGTSPYQIKRFHPDGTIAQEGLWCGGDLWTGTYRWTKSDHPTTEPFPVPAEYDSPFVWIAEFDYPGDGPWYNAQRYFNRERQPVNAEGVPLPARPATVSQRAHYAIEHGQHKWVMGTVNIRIAKYVGEYQEWDLNGALKVRRIYNEDGEIALEESYEYGSLWMSKAHSPGELLQTFYYISSQPPVAKSASLYRNGGQDVTTAYFDTAGNKLYSVRSERLMALHERRYYNDALVYEGVQLDDKPKTLVSVKYFYPDGSILVDYTSNGDGTGVWRLFERSGAEMLSMEEKEEAFRSKRKRWAYLLPSLSDYEEDTLLPDWESVVENFKMEKRRQLTREKMAALVAPAHLSKELKKTDWENIDTAMGGGSRLPLAVKGLLSDDNDVASMSADIIWYEIEHQQSLYEATYKIAGIVAKMLPLYGDTPAIQQRMRSFLFEVFGQAYFDYPKKAYKATIKSLLPAAPLLLRWANDSDNDTARQAQYLLLHMGEAVPDTETLLLQEWNNTAHTAQRRQFAAFLLARYYLNSKQPAKLVSMFSEALQTETDKLLRLIMAIHLVLATKKQAQAAWLSELLQALTDPDAAHYDDFYALTPYTTGTDVSEYALMVLGHAKKAVLEDNIFVLINMLPESNSLKQVTLLQALFSVLFPDGVELNKFSPAQQQTLLAAATVIDQHPNFVNHMEVFSNFNIPYDTYELTQLAARPVARSRKKAE